MRIHHCSKAKKFIDMRLSDREFKPTSSNPRHMYNHMHMPPPLMLPYYHRITKEDAAICRRLEMIRRQNLERFWNHQLNHMRTTSELKSSNQLPLARIKRVMKSDESVRVKYSIFCLENLKEKGMVSADTPILFAKACEFFILELTLRAWMVTEECQRRTIQHGDIARAIRKDRNLAFLTNVVPLTQNHQEDVRGKMPMQIQPEPVINPLQFHYINGNEDLTMNQDGSNPFMMMMNSPPDFNFEFPPK